MSLLFYSFTSFTLRMTRTHIHRCVCVFWWFREQNFIILPSNGVRCWFQLQFPHRLQCSTKFQCKINNKHCIQKSSKTKKKSFVYTSKDSSGSIYLYLHIERCWQTVDRLMCTKLFIISSFFLFIRLLLPKKYSQNYNYHLSTTWNSSCYNEKIPFFLPKYKRAQLEWIFFFQID